MAITPYKHQREAVTKLGHPDLPGRLVADDMGLGKTLEALLIDCELRSERHGTSQGRADHPAYKRPTLIVAPIATHYDAWEPAIRSLPDLVNWSPEGFDHNIAVIDPKNRGALVSRLKSPKGPPCYVIVHYEALRLLPELKDIKWFHIIADEVHRIKNRKAQSTAALKQLQTFYKTGCSGTPADDKPQDLWSILNWLYPKEYSSYWRFIGRYCEQQTQEVRSQGRTFKKIVGVNRQTMPELHANIRPWYIRRKKEDVLDSLPPKTYTEYHVDLHPEQRRAYEQMRKDMIAWVGENQEMALAAPVVVAQLVRLQQFALASVTFGDNNKVTLIDPSAKADRLMQIVEGNPNESLVVFTQSRSMVDLVVRRARGAGTTALPYTGNVSERDRVRTIQAFQAGDVQLFVATIAAGREGITLHRSSTGIFLDRSWNPTRNFQAEDRLHRIGQTRPVQIIDILARNTVDQGRNQRIANKWEELLWLLGDKTSPRPSTTASFDAVAMFMGE